MYFVIQYTQLPITYKSFILLSGQTRADTNISAANSAIWAPTDFIQWSIHWNNYFLFNRHTFTHHRSIFMQPDLEVYCQLGSPMLNGTFTTQCTTCLDRLIASCGVVRCLMKVSRASEWPARRRLTWETPIDNTYSGWDAQIRMEGWYNHRKLLGKNIHHHLLFEWSISVLSSRWCRRKCWCQRGCGQTVA